MEDARGSEKVAVTRSTLPLGVAGLASNISSAVRTGAALSAGAVAANEDRLSAASRMPAAFWARATVNEPTAVFVAPAPSFSTSVAVEPLVETLARVAPLGAFESVHGPVAVELWDGLVEGGDDAVDLAVAVVVAHFERAQRRRRVVGLHGHGVARRRGCGPGPVDGRDGVGVRAVEHARVVAARPARDEARCGGAAGGRGGARGGVLARDVVALGSDGAGARALRGVPVDADSAAPGGPLLATTLFLRVERADRARRGSGTRVGPEGIGRSGGDEQRQDRQEDLGDAPDHHLVACPP